MNPPAHRLAMLIQTRAVGRLAAAGGADDELRETHGRRWAAEGLGRRGGVGFTEGAAWGGRRKRGLED